ncbi:c-type cytochrome [Kurthia sibirica]|uniref:Cytochrome C n=1 Tax=Kurthia sibirica TaxID=202750 RepID=A0A2U3AM49_9BACL|nr:cytochrome c [Kurthia sibirica]PWI25577.1 cytochrome C [Kurthia sibirica]GEK35360.1 cytochrome c-550 [Kurthia sibirica]
MKKNPIVPYLLIIAFGLGLIFYMSLIGVDKKQEAKNNDAKTEQGEKNKGSASETDPKAITSAKCISCHGDDLKGGGSAPSLHGTGLKTDAVKKILVEGRGGMPAGLLSDDSELDAVAKYIADLK